MGDEEVRRVIQIPIGQFSKMTRLSVKALRLYDENGLLAPAHVDPSTGYRYYEPGQAGRAEMVKILRTVGMPLDEIRAIVATNNPDLAPQATAGTPAAPRRTTGGPGAGARLPRKAHPT